MRRVNSEMGDCSLGLLYDVVDWSAVLYVLKIVVYMNCGVCVF